MFYNENETLLEQKAGLYLYMIKTFHTWGKRVNDNE